MVQRAGTKRRTKAPGRAEKRKRGRHEGKPHGGAHPFWSGTISFGLVSVPVNLFPSTRSAGSTMRMLAADGAPLERRYYCAEEERDVGWEELVRGYEVSEDEVVPLTDDELEAVAPRKSRDIDLRLFVEEAELDPFLFERAYVLTPGGESTKPYRLLADVMERKSKAGIATFVMRGKEYLVAIVARAGILWAETLRFADELRSTEEVGLGRPARAPKSLVNAFGKAIRGLEADALDRDELRDERLERVSALVQQKRDSGKDLVQAPRAPAKGKKLAAPEDAGEGGEAPDLLETIRRSLAGKGMPKAEPRAKVSTAPRTTKSARSARVARGSKAREALERLSKRELYERAQEREIAGRSEMTKEELVEALRDAR